MKKLIVTGSRDLIIKYPLSISDFVNYFTSYKGADEIVSGGAKGIDAAGEQYALFHSKTIKKFEADVYSNGAQAERLKNKQMVKYADSALIIWDGDSAIIDNLKEQMINSGKPVYEVILARYNEE